MVKAAVLYTEDVQVQVLLGGLCSKYAPVVESAYTADLKSAGLTVLRVQVSPGALKVMLSIDTHYL